MAGAELLNETSPSVGQQASGVGEEQRKLDELLNRIHQLTSNGGEPLPPAPASPPATHPTLPRPVAQHPATMAPGAPAGSANHAAAWHPIEPESLASGGLTDSEVEDLILKLLSSRSEATGRFIADSVRLPFRLVSPLLQSLKQDQFIAHKGAAMMNDYVYQLDRHGPRAGAGT